MAQSDFYKASPPPLKNHAESRVFLDDLRKIEEPPVPASTHVEAEMRTVETHPSVQQAAPVPEPVYAPPPVIHRVEAPSRDKLKPRIEGNWRYSNDRSILMSEIWVPLAQNVEAASVLFGDVRIMGDNNDNTEFNAGIGYRDVLNNTRLGDGVAGGMVWFDRRLTQRDSEFNQVTVGGEWLTEDWDVRVNGYVPLNDSNTFTQANPNGSGAGFAGNQVFVNTDQTVVEEALPGADLEIGYRLKFLDGITDATRVYAGGYHFEGDQAEDVSGFRTRFTSDITQDVQIGARYQHDDERGSQTYLEATVRFPMGFKKSFKEEGLYARLDESPERDIDIVSSEAVIDQGVTNTTLLNAQTGLAQNIIHVDNTNGAGTGTAEDPFNTLAAAEAAAGVNDMIYVHRGDGTTTGMSDGITLNDAGQMLAGSGANLLFSRDRFRTAGNRNISGTIVNASQAPVITNGAGNGIDLTADNIFVSGIIVDGATGHGIDVLNITGTTWNQGIAIQNVTARNNTESGIFVDVDGAGSEITTVDFIGNRASANTERGIYARARNSGTIGTVNFRNNLASTNIIDGLQALPTGVGSRIDIINFDDNVTTNNTRYGISSFALSGGYVGSVTIQNNSIVNNGDSGSRSSAQDAGSIIESITYTNNDIRNNGARGIYIEANTSGVINTVNVNNNFIDANTNQGIRIESDDVGSVINDVMVTENISTNNGNSGLWLLGRDDGVMNRAVVQNNTFTGSSTNGVSVTEETAASVVNADLGGGAFGSVGNNRIFNNDAFDVGASLNGDVLKAENNWWGTTSGLDSSEFSGTFNGEATIDSSPHLFGDPDQ